MTSAAVQPGDFSSRAPLSPLLVHCLSVLGWEMQQEFLPSRKSKALHIGIMCKSEAESLRILRSQLGGENELQVGSAGPVSCYYVIPGIHGERGDTQTLTADTTKSLPLH